MGEPPKKRFTRTTDVSQAPPASNLNEETKVLQQMLNKFCSGLSEKKELGQTLINSSKKPVNVVLKIGEKYDNDGYSAGHTFLATITCPICHETRELSKVGVTSDRNSRWVITNFNRHVETHVQAEEKKKQAKKNLRNFEAAFSNSAQSGASTSKGTPGGSGAGIVNQATVSSANIGGANIHSETTIDNEADMMDAQSLINDKVPTSWGNY